MIMNRFITIIVAVGLFTIFLSIPQITYSASTQIAYGDLIEGSIDSAGDSNAYRFQGQAGDTVTIRMVEVDAALGPKLSLYGPDNTLLKTTWEYSYASGASTSWGGVNIRAIKRVTDNHKGCPYECG